MSKQRITADNFEQLIEIVRAVQRGKDPEKALQEDGLGDDEPGLAEEEAESRTPEERRADEQKLDRLLGQENSPAEPDGAAEDGRDAGKPRAAGGGALSVRLRGFLSGISGSRKKTGAEKRPKKRDAGEKRPKKRDAGEDAPEEERAGEVRPEEDPESGSDVPGRPETENAGSRRSGAGHPAAAPAEKTQETPPDDGTAPGGHQTDDSALLSGLRSRAAALRENLSGRGFQRREMILAALGVLLALFVVIVIIRAATQSQIQKRKMEHVTADSGLTVLVEDEPEKWCTSYPVRLTIRAQSEALERATVNGTGYVLDEKGGVTVEVSDPLVEISVETAQGTLKAQAEIPLIDALPPAVHVEKNEDLITVTAADANSEISRIRYAVVHNDQYIKLPLYQDYSEPLPFEKDSLYYFYAQDAAGNRCAPVVTTTETAQSLGLGREELSLFPGETSYLDVQVEPEGALLNNLKYASADPAVVTVESGGRITAAGEGSTVVTVSADEVSEVSCKVTVSESRTVTISAVGDCTLGTDENFNTQTSFQAFDIVNGHSWFFRNVKDILDNDDATFANLEGTFTTETQREIKEYAFRGDPSYTQILLDGSIDVVTLANNHSSDYGPQSLADTKQYLTEAGIDYCMENEIVLKNVNDIPTAFIGIYVLDDGMASEKELREAIAEAQRQGARLIVVAFHWGTEQATTPDETQRELAHIAVDCGASLVVGHHPHVLQGIEKYNGVYIVYSLGNFCFGGNSAPSDMDTMIFRQSFTVSGAGVADDDRIEIIPCSISSTPYYNDYRPTPAQGTEAERIMGRINEYSAEFGTSFTASDGLN